VRILLAFAYGAVPSIRAHTSFCLVRLPRVFLAHVYTEPPTHVRQHVCAGTKKGGREGTRECPKEFSRVREKERNAMMSKRLMTPWYNVGIAKMTLSIISSLFQAKMPIVESVSIELNSTRLPGNHGRDSRQ
jgi:hypothetical protein